MKKDAVDARQMIAALFEGDQQTVERLEYVIEGIEEYEDPFERALHAAQTTKSNDPASAHRRLSYLKGVSEAKGKLRIGDRTGAFLHICAALCLWQKDARKAYEASVDFAKQLDEERRAGRSAHVRRLSAHFKGAIKAADEMATMPGWNISGKEAQTFNVAAKTFLAALDARYPPTRILLTHPSELSKQFAYRLVWATFHIGFSNVMPRWTATDAADVAKAIAVLHGVSVSKESMRTYAGELQSLRRDDGK